MKFLCIAVRELNRSAKTEFVCGICCPGKAKNLAFAEQKMLYSRSNLKFRLTFKGETNLGNASSGKLLQRQFLRLSTG